MSSQRRAWLQMHFCVLLWGFTAILGRVITISALPLVLWRMGLVALALFLVPRVWRGLLAMPASLAWCYLGIGVLVALHWLTFYGAIKLANASVGVTCIATVPIFLAMIEPVLTGSRFQWRQLALGLLVLPGIVLLVGGTPATMNVGIVVGLVSALFVALFSSLNKRLILRAGSLTVTALEMGAGAVFLALAGVAAVLAGEGLFIELFVQDPAVIFALPGAEDLGWLALLAFGCTLLPFALSLIVLRRLSAYATALVVNMEPIYAIVLAIVLLGEQRQLQIDFYFGAALIIAVVFLYPVLQKEEPRSNRDGEMS